ncbi:MAG TPA: FAD-binding oxidoreductase [Candidatus Kapabacteria bacterium]|nr:FAD-binding oxidoreductase [Candidatus Kapabacteria bacterium]
MPAIEPNISPSVINLADRIHQADSTGKCVCIQGAGTHSFGTTNGELLSTLDLNAVVDYAPDDMTITVEAGLPWNELQNTLKTHRQWLPIEPSVSAKSTVGGVVASNGSGCSRYRYGTARNWLLGARFVTANGEIVHSGSKVVKSVAGYDLHKLLIGSFGSLAAIAELTFKVAPVPEQRTIALVKGEMPASSLSQITSKLHPLLPSFVVYGNKRFTSGILHEADPCIVIGFDGFAEDVAAQVKGLRELLAAQELQIVSNEQEINKLYSAITSFTFNKPEAIRIGSLPSDIAKFIPLVEQSPALIDLANGTADIVPATENISALSQMITSNGLRGVYLWQNEKPVLAGAVPEAEKKLARRLKETFDPHGVFNQRGYYL